MKGEFLIFQILEDLPFGAGILSEEGSECSNKIFRFNRRHHARQSSLEANLQDAFTRSHYQSDPKIQQIFNKTRRQNRSKAKKPLSQAVLALLANPEEELKPPSAPESEPMQVD